MFSRSSKRNHSALVSGGIRWSIALFGSIEKFEAGKNDGKSFSRFGSGGIRWGVFLKEVKVVEELAWLLVSVELWWVLIRSGDVLTGEDGVWYGADGFGRRRKIWSVEAGDGYLCVGHVRLRRCTRVVYVFFWEGVLFRALILGLFLGCFMMGCLWSFFCLIIVGPVSVASFVVFYLW